MAADLGGEDLPLRPSSSVPRNLLSLSIPTSGFHPVLEVRQEQLHLVLVLPDDEALGELPQQRDRQGVVGLNGRLCPASLGLEHPAWLSLLVRTAT
jgi:hypothetical protein